MERRIESIVLSLALFGLVAGCAEDEGDETPSSSPPTTCAEVDRSAEGSSSLQRGEEEVTLSGTYRLSGENTYDASEEVTIEPGTVFLMDANAFLRFGWRNSEATVHAEGTEEEPILFCGRQEGAGHWNGIKLLNGTTDDSTLEHVRIEDAGANDNAALRSKVDARLDSVAAVGNANTGIRLGGLAEGSSDLAAGENAVPLELQSQSAITNAPDGDYTGNDEDVALVSGFNQSSATFGDLGIPYRQDTRRLRFGTAGEAEPSLTFEAGVEYQFCEDCFIQMGWRSDAASLFVEGAEDDPVVFTSARGADAEPGDWNGIELLGGLQPDSVIEHAEFYYGGKQDSGNLIVDGAGPTIADSHFADSAGYGIYVANAGDELSMSNNTYEDNAQGDTNQ